MIMIPLIKYNIALTMPHTLVFLVYLFVFAIFLKFILFGT